MAISSAMLRADRNVPVVRQAGTMSYTDLYPKTYVVAAANDDDIQRMKCYPVEYCMWLASEIFDLTLSTSQIARAGARRDSYPCRETV